MLNMADLTIQFFVKLVSEIAVDKNKLGPVVQSRP